MLNEISRAKDSLITPEEYEKTAGDDFRQKIIARAYKLYQQRLRDADAMDFDDLINKTVELFRACPDVLEYYQDRFKYLMVDEYQDTNHAQYTFVRLLAEKHQNLCVVGDDDQSIYKFRGATIENILSFENTFQNAQVIRLEQNYARPEYSGRGERRHRKQHGAQGQNALDAERHRRADPPAHRRKRDGRSGTHREDHPRRRGRRAQVLGLCRFVPDELAVDDVRAQLREVGHSAPHHRRHTLL